MLSPGHSRLTDPAKPYFDRTLDCRRPRVADLIANDRFVSGSGAIDCRQMDITTPFSVRYESSLTDAWV